MTDQADLPALMLQHVNPQSIRVDPDTSTVPSEMMLCLQMLANIAADPSRVRLVVTGDFVSSVQARLEQDGVNTDFDVDRGSGMVAGKTMPQPDGSIDVLIPWWFFNAELDAEQRAVTAELAVRTVIHEAYHVAMRQNQQGYEHLDNETWRDRNFLAAADSIVDEYRAEAGVMATFEEDESYWSPVEVLDTLSRELVASVASYQEHVDLERLVVDIGNSCIVAWRALAYIAAVDIADSIRSPLTTEVQAHPLWRKMAAPFWSDFRELLQVIPSGGEVMAQGDLSAAIERLSALLGRWQVVLGFVWTDNYFHVEDWFFGTDEYLRLVSDEGSP